MTSGSSQSMTTASAPPAAPPSLCQVPACGGRGRAPLGRGGALGKKERHWGGDANASSSQCLTAGSPGSAFGRSWGRWLFGVPSQRLQTRWAGCPVGLWTNQWAQDETFHELTTQEIQGRQAINCVSIETTPQNRQSQQPEKHGLAHRRDRAVPGWGGLPSSPFSPHPARAAHPASQRPLPPKPVTPNLTTNHL